MQTQPTAEETRPQYKNVLRLYFTTIHYNRRRVNTLQKSEFIRAPKFNKFSQAYLRACSKQKFKASKTSTHTVTNMTTTNFRQVIPLA